MRFGVTTCITDESIQPCDLARAIEERGLESLFVSEHTHIPPRVTPYPLAGGDDLPREAYRTYDPFVALAAAATATRRLVLGTGIALVTQRDPIILAKEVATLDHLSGGRVVLGVGAGWNLEEVANHGTNPASRMALMRERILAVREIWSRDEASFHGSFVDFERIQSHPKPIQSPHPPILLGGWGPTILQRVLDYADGWFPPFAADAPALIARIEELRRGADERGRNRPEVTVAAMTGADISSSSLEALAGGGVDRLTFVMPTGTPQHTLHWLDDLVHTIELTDLETLE